MSAIAPAIKVLVVQGEGVMRAGLVLLLESQRFQVVAQLTLEELGGASAAHYQPDVILLDIHQKDGGLDFDCIPKLLEKMPLAKILVLTGVRDLGMLYKIVMIGAYGIVRKTDSSEALVAAITKVHAGEVWVDGALAARMLSDLWTTKQSDVPTAQAIGSQAVQIVQTWQQAGSSEPDEAAKIAQLTEREREVIGLLGEGLRNQQIADRLSLSVITVRHHLSSIFAKLDVGDRFELAIYSYHHGLAKLPL